MGRDSLERLAVELQAEVERLQAENERLRSTPTDHVCVSCGEHILFSRRCLCGVCARPEAEHDAYEQMREVTQRNIDLRSENGRLRSALAHYAAAQHRAEKALAADNPSSSNPSPDECSTGSEL